MGVGAAGPPWPRSAARRRRDTSESTRATCGQAGGLGLPWWDAISTRRVRLQRIQRTPRSGSRHVRSVLLRPSRRKRASRIQQASRCRAWGSRRRGSRSGYRGRCGDTIAWASCARASPLGPDHCVGVRQQHGQFVSRLEQRPHQAELASDRAEPSSPAVWGGHRDDSVRGCCERFTRRTALWPYLVDEEQVSNPNEPAAWLPPRRTNGCGHQ